MNSANVTEGLFCFIPPSAFRPPPLNSLPVFPEGMIHYLTFGWTDVQPGMGYTRKQ